MSESTGLRRVLELVAPSVRASVAAGSFAPSSYATPLALAALALEVPFIVAVTATSSDAEHVRDALVAWLGEREVALWPGWDTHPLERVSPDSQVMAMRALLRWQIGEGTNPRVIVASARSIAQLLSPEPLRAPYIVRRGSEIDRGEFVEGLVAMGYRREHLVEHRAEIAVRGGIVDVWPAQNDEPLRLDFFGDEVERLTVFDIATQRSTHDLEEAVIAPAREWMPGASTRQRAEALSTSEPWASATFDRLAAGQLFDGMEGWMGLFVDQARTLLNEAADAHVVVVEPERVRARLHDLLDEERELTDVVAATWRASATVPLLHLSYDEVFAGKVDLALETSASSLGTTGQLTSPPVVQGDAARIAAHVRGWTKERRGVVLTSTPGAIERMADQLRAEGLDVTSDPRHVLQARLSVLESSLPAGFSLDDPEVVVWSESDLTGRRSQRRTSRARARTVDGFFDDLTVGSYVVHRQHGVARFSGTTTRAINGVTRDYLILQFKDGKSYWPTEQIDALTPYTGGDGPALSRLGGAEWQRTRAKARAAAYLVAQELVDLYRLRSVAEGHAFSPDTAWQREMEELFPYTLTADQSQAILDVKSDMESPRPMDRLICADVGFGKTEVALRAVFKAVQDNTQAAILVPTTLLASQHYATFSERFAGFPVKVALLSRFVDEAETKSTLQGLAEGTIDVVIGTHRLLSDSVSFKRLGLLVVDEEQRFGVQHKETIKTRSVGVDVLTLSASPIPRTLEMAFTGIRDLSMITTPPADRRPILTHVGEYNEPAVIEAVRRELLREGQIFFVHNRVSDIDQAAKRLGQLVPDARIAVAHGQMDEGTLERVMIDFWQRRYDVLVCTTIVESGIDLPSVNTLIVDRSERLGLGQLHQLRGRVGRSGQRAYAYLFHPVDQVLSETAYERLRTIGDNTALGSGFKIAMRDLEIRGAGNLLGHDQSGPVAAVGYDLYVQLVAEAVADAKGFHVPDVVPITLDVPGEAHLPKEYVEADDARLEAYRRLAGVTTLEELNDLRNEWIDRYGALPPPSVGLLELAQLRLVCLDYGVSSVKVLPARVGLRSKPLLKLGPLSLTLSQQLRLRRTHGSTAYNDTTKELRLERAAHAVTPHSILALLEELNEPSKEPEE
ncbi:MAG TPA: transcription-repair coupling factor [Acidimicrobiales bacterium]|nr:transcription-repair coupling factor [Acidimicrobiales bacterium]